MPVLLALFETHSFDQARQAAAFVGLTPTHQESGASLRRHPRLSKMGNPLIRKQLWWPAIRAMRHPDFIPWVEGLRERGKPNKAIICAVMRRLIQIAFGVLRSQTPYDKKIAFPA